MAFWSVKIIFEIIGFFFKSDLINNENIFEIITFFKLNLMINANANDDGGSAKTVMHAPCLIFTSCV